MPATNPLPCAQNATPPPDPPQARTRLQRSIIQAGSAIDVREADGDDQEHLTRG